MHLLVPQAGLENLEKGQAAGLWQSYEVYIVRWLLEPNLFNALWCQAFVNASLMLSRLSLSRKFESEREKDHCGLKGFLPRQELTYWNQLSFILPKTLADIYQYQYTRAGSPILIKLLKIPLGFFCRAKGLFYSLTPIHGDLLATMRSRLLDALPGRTPLSMPVVSELAGDSTVHS